MLSKGPFKQAPGCCPVADTCTFRTGMPKQQHLDMDPSAGRAFMSV